MLTQSLYAKDQHGNIRQWTITATAGKVGLIRITHGIIDGEKIISEEEISEGLAGRTITEQTYSRFNSRFNKKLDSGYVRTIEEAMQNRRVNPLGYARPMLAKPFKNVVKKIDFSKGVHAQRKYNGHRCLIRNDNGTLVSYSRNGKIIDSIDHILEEIEIPIGATLDGELYLHGEKFQTISSWIKRKQPQTKNLVYMVYDFISEDTFSDRFSQAKFYIGNNLFSIPAETTTIFSEEEAVSWLGHFIEEGYEGAILRVDGSPYEDSKRSNSLIKMKKFLDDEFLVVAVRPSSEGWGILDCVTKEGKKFSVSAPGTFDQKTEILENKNQYIGKFAHVEFSEYTATKVPFHPVCIGFRDKSAE